MASSLALRSLFSKSLRPHFRALASSPSVSRSLNTNAVRHLDEDVRSLDDRISDRSSNRRGDFAPGSFSGNRYLTSVPLFDSIFLLFWCFVYQKIE